MTRLEELDITIGDLLLYDHTPDSKQGKTIHLPRLKRLVITEDGCPLNDAYWFLLHCVLPALENLMVSLLSHHFGDYSPIVQEIASHLIAEGNFCNFRSLELGDDCFRLSPDAQKRSFPHAGEFPVIVYLPIDCIFEYNDNHSLLVAEFLSCIRPLDHDNSLPLVRLSLDGDLLVSLTKDELLQLFGHLPDLQAISIPHTIVAPFVESLKHLPDSPPNVPTPYPRLNSILCQGDFPGYGVKFPRPPLFDDFIDCLTHRHSGGVPIRKLELYFYSVSKKEIKALKDIGINVKTR
ncbi:hypothetical protein D9619_010051 [Psilocybe cf. subviscida]|uniref:Uncharacterized protein n=1 Tax=Psilocybe cf. subviscida TaxID=2480587 RepID=A0A8H5BL29_9AGAR|nr:hypothetical protein D9619_010051 [Psilocybe cf. subviscida]